MQLAPATLSTITAILAAQGVSVNHAQLQNALAPLTGEKPSATELQPGEEIWLIEYPEYGSDKCRVHNGFKTLESVAEHIADRIRHTKGSNRGYYGSGRKLEADDFDVLIVRKVITPQIEEKIAVTI